MKKICPSFYHRVFSTDWRARLWAAENGLGLGELKNDPISYIRVAVAKNGYALDELINDEDYPVRVAVAARGYRLDKLLADPSPSCAQL